MATKIIKALVNGAIQDIEVEVMTSPELLPSVEERVDTLEDKHEVVFTDGNFLVGNGTTELKEMTPEETLEHINGATVATMTTSEYEVLEETNANTLYILTDVEDDNKLNEIVLIDVINGYQYILQMQNGHLVSFCSIESIEVTSSPKLTYKAGESFDSTGMVLTATCHDGTTRVISNYTVSPEILSEEDTYVTVHYIEGGKEYTVDIDIEILGVEALLTDFTYTKNEDGTFTLTGWNGTYNGEASTKCVIPSTDGKVEI